ncbi:MAG: beta strand repeat-containing protein, partial [Cytophagales bacterium]
MDKMKKVGKYGSWLIVSALLLYVQMANAQKTLGIGTDKPNPRAILELKVEDPSVYSQGLLLPRLNNLQRANLAGNLTAADAGMSVYDTSDKTFYTWDGAQWNSSSTLLTSILGINGITVTQTGNAFTISGANASQWISTVGGIFYTTSVGINGIAPTTGTGLNIKSFGLSTKPIRVENSAGTFPLFEIDEGSGGNGNLLLYNSTGTLLNQISSTNPTFFNGGASVGIGTSSPNQKLTVQGNSSVTGIGYFSSIAGLALNGASAGSVVTVDGTGKLGFGALASSTPSQWTTSGTNIYYQGSNANNGFVGIGTSTPTVLFQINYVPSTGFDLVGSQLTYNFSNATGNLKGLKIDFTSTPSSSSSEASKGIELNSNNSFTNTDGDAYGLNVISNSSGNGANAFVVGVLNDVRGNLTGAGSTKLGYYTFVQNAATTNIGIRAHATGALNNYAAIFDEGLVGIGTLNPNKDLTVVGETSVTGIAYLGTIIGNNLAGASGSVVTVDGVGRMGIGTVASSTQYLTINGNNLQPIDNYGFNLSLSGAYRINGTQIIGTSNIPTAVNNVFLGGAGNTSITGSNNLFFGTSTGIGIS